MAKLTLLTGPVGAGKTTLARQRLAARPSGLLLDVDACMVRLYGADPRPAEGVLAWYGERRERVRELLWAIAGEALDAGLDVYLELGLLTVAERQQAAERALAEDRQIEILVVDAPRDVRRQRVLARNAAAGPLTQVVPEAFFERASDAWEPVTEAERADWPIADA